MNDIFDYKWHELTKGRRLTANLILQAIILAVIVGFGPNLIPMLMGYGSDIYIYQFKFMIVAIPVIIVISVISYYNNPVTDVTTSSLSITHNTAKVTRHVIAETGRRFFVTWDSIEIMAYKINEFHRVIQIDAKWGVSAYRMKGEDAGAFVDSDIRTYPQTFQFTPEAFYSAVAYLREKYPDKMTNMTKEEYEKAEPFIHKHYEI